MARPNPKKQEVEVEAAVEVEAVETQPKPKMVTVYHVNPDAADPDEGERKPVKDNSVGGVILDAIMHLEADGKQPTKAAILEEFRVSEIAGKLKAKQWFEKPQEYVNGYVDWLKGNRSVVSEKVEA